MQFPIESERIKSGEIAFEKDESKICGWDAGLEYEEIYKYIADEFSYEDRIHFLDHIIGKRCAQGHDPCQLIPSSKKLESRSTKGYICPDCHEFTEFFSGYLEGIDPEYIVFDIAILLSLDTMIEITIKNFSDPILLPYLDIELETLDFHTFLGRGLPSMVLDNSEISVNNKIVLGSEKMHEFIPIQSIVLENQKVNIGKNLQNYLHEQKMEREKWVAEAWGFGEDDVKPQEYSWWPLVFDIVKLIGSIGFLVGIFFLVEFLRDKDLIS